MKKRAFPFIASSLGTSILELTVAVVLTTIVVSILYATWRQINTHIGAQQQKTNLQNECNRITDLFNQHLKKTEKVLRWDRNSMLIELAESHDTISYYFNGIDFTYNDKPFHFVNPHIIIKTFEIENSNRGIENKPYLFHFTITLMDTLTADTTSVTSTIMVKEEMNVDDQSDRDFIW